MLERDLSEIFKEFANKEVALKETHIEGKRRTNIIYDMPEGKDPVIEGIKEKAQKQGLSVRFWLPNAMGTSDAQPNRLNVYFDQSNNGKWHVSPHFTLG